MNSVHGNLERLITLNIDPLFKYLHFQIQSSISKHCHIFQLAGVCLPTIHNRRSINLNEVGIGPPPDICCTHAKVFAMSAFSQVIFLITDLLCRTIYVLESVHS
jgi:hypothetical protein